jgi:hypothetical protein
MYDLTQRIHRRQRAERLARIQEQIADGRLKVRQAGSDELEQWRIERERRRRLDAASTGNCQAPFLPRTAIKEG